MKANYTLDDNQALRGRAIDFNVNEDLEPHVLDMIYRGHWPVRGWHNGTIAARSVIYRGREVPLPAVQLIAVSKEGNASVLDFMSVAVARQFAADILEAAEDAERAYQLAYAQTQDGAVFRAMAGKSKDWTYQEINGACFIHRSHPLGDMDLYWSWQPVSSVLWLITTGLIYWPERGGQSYQMAQSWLAVMDDFGHLVDVGVHQ